MKQETIERLKLDICEHETCEKCADFRDILAVLEAAQRYAESYRAEMEAIQDLEVSAEDFEARSETRITKHDALLALIDLSDDLRVLGGTK